MNNIYENSLVKHVKRELGLLSKEFCKDNPTYKLEKEFFGKVKDVILAMAHTFPDPEDLGEAVYFISRLVVFSPLTTIQKPTPADFFCVANKSSEKIYVHNRYPYLLSLDGNEWYILAKDGSRVFVKFPLHPVDIEEINDFHLNSKECIK